MDQTTIAELKRDLYRAILLVPDDMLTENEIEIGYYLSMDKDIQGILGRKLKKEIRNQGNYNP